jgi:hypothetical protein
MARAQESATRLGWRNSERLPVYSCLSGFFASP